MLWTLESFVDCPKFCTFYANQRRRRAEGFNSLQTMIHGTERRMKCLYQQVVRVFLTESPFHCVTRGRRSTKRLSVQNVSAA